MGYTQHKGVDISHWQSGELGMNAAKQAGVEFWFEKATEGLSTDPTFAERQPRIRATFDVRGFYHFCHSSVDAVQQGEHFSNIIGTLQPHEFAAFDVEAGWGSLTDEAGVDYIIKIVKAFQAKNGATDAQIIIYGSLGWLRGQFGPALSKLTVYHLWAARYGVTELGPTSPWEASLIWQNNQYGTITGIGTKEVDCDVWLDGHYPV